MSKMASATLPIHVKKGDLINNRYLVGHGIGRGSFGFVFLGMDKLTNKNVAIKVEGKRNRDFTQLHKENMVLQRLDGGRLNLYTNRVGGFPMPFYFGVHNEIDMVLVMELLGPDLDYLFHVCKKKFSMKTILLLTDQLLNRLQYLHSRGYIHRDLKPSNIIMGSQGKRDIVHLIDFGLAVTYWSDAATEEHVKDSGKKFERGGHIGTAKFMSCRSHEYRQVSRRDDMESLAYTLAYFLKTLPWQNITGETEEQKADKIAAMKRTLTPEEIFEGAPLQFAEYLKLVKQLKFEEEPDYVLYQWMFRELGKVEGIEYWRGKQFDWKLVERKGTQL